MGFLLLDQPPNVATLADDFSVDDLATKWPASHDGATISGGAAHIPSVAAYAGLATSKRYRLTGSSIYAQVTPDTSGISRDTILKLTDQAGYNTQLFFSAGIFQALVFLSSFGTTRATAITYDPVAHAWWRIREAAGTLYYDGSPDGSAWTQYFSLPYSTYTPVLGTSAMLVEFLSGYYDTFSDVDSVGSLVDNVNTAAGYTAAPGDFFAFF